jgi:hypothetical protein
MKIFFPGLAACLFLAVLSCGIDEKNDRQGGVVTLNISEDSGGRALDGPIAKAVSNFYEATFQRVSDNKIIRTTWNYAQRGKIQIDPGTYTVLLMAGRNADKTLLGVGQATGIGGSGSISTDNPLQVTITGATTDLYFHAYPLMNDINDTTDSTFKTEITTFPFLSDQYEEDDFDNKVPVFMINPNNTTTATWEFGLGALPGTTFVASDPTTGVGSHGVPGSGDQISVFGPYIRVTGNPRLIEKSFYSPPTTFDSELDAKSFIELTEGDKITGTFNMSFTAPNESGIVQISPEVPVVAIENSDKPVIWYIQGGLDNGLLDAGKTPSHEKAGVIGGAFLLKY